MAAILIQEGPLAGRRVEVSGEMLIGRDRATLTVPDSEVSRRHAVIRPAGDGLEIEDLGSLNGTWVNGHRVMGVSPLAAADTVRLGSTVFSVELASPPVPMETPPEDPSATPAPMPAAPQPGPRAGPEAPAAAFAPGAVSPTRRRPATRGIAAVVVTFSIVAATAVLLLAYFAFRNAP
jgi:pSer/pThr/pTyr-binding forkhead associated (FHA) protein